MFTLNGVRKFHGWTHASLDLVLDHLSTIPTSDYMKELPGFGFPTLRAQAIRRCEAPAAGSQRADHAYLSKLTDQQLNTNKELLFSDGDTAVRAPALVLHHVLTHAFHHKGQMVAMCRALGYPAHDTDLNQFE